MGNLKKKKKYNTNTQKNHEHKCERERERERERVLTFFCMVNYRLNGRNDTKFIQNKRERRIVKI